MSVGWLVAGSIPRQVPAGHTLDWSMSATLPVNVSCWLLAPGSCRPHSIRRSPGLPPRLVAGPQHADGELAVGVEPRAQVALHGGLALLLADLLDARRRRRFGVGSVLGSPGRSACRPTRRPRNGALRRSSRSRPRPGVRSGQVRQSPLLRVVEGVVAAGAERDRVGRSGRSARYRRLRQRGDHAGDQQAAQCGEQQRPPGGRRPAGCATTATADDCSRPCRRGSLRASVSGASNIRSIVTGVSRAVTRDAVVASCGCACDRHSASDPAKVGLRP